MSAPLSPRHTTSTFLRSFLIQGSWNYHTMLGSGFAFALMPVLRRLSDGDRGALEERVRRHLEHFNAHPYLAGLALGAAVRLELEGEDPGEIRRFKTAVRGPLGSLGDSLVWGSWLPLVSLVALAAYWLGAPALVAALLFLGLYNAGHLTLRVWSFQAGLSRGRAVAHVLGRLHVPVLTERLRSAAALLLGVLVAAILAAEGSVADAGWLWTAGAALAFLAGLFVGHTVWRPAAVAVVAAVALLATWGVVT